MTNNMCVRHGVCAHARTHARTHAHTHAVSTITVMKTSAMERRDKYLVLLSTWVRSMLHCMARRNFAGKQQQNDSTSGVNNLGSTFFGSAAPNNDVKNMKTT